MFLRLSLSSERAASSPSESAVIVTSVVECLRYCIVHHTDEDEDQKTLRTMLISQKVCSSKLCWPPCLFLAPFNLLDLFVAASPAGESSGQSLLAEWSSVPHGHGNALVLGEQGRLTW